MIFLFDEPMNSLTTKTKTDTASRFTAISTYFLSAAALAFMSLLRSLWFGSW
jgi:hypothetical protein